MSEIFVDLGIDVDPVEYVAKRINYYRWSLEDEGIRHARAVEDILHDYVLVMNKIRIDSKLDDEQWDKFIKLCIKKAHEVE